MTLPSEAEWECSGPAREVRRSRLQPQDAQNVERFYALQSGAEI